MSYLQVARQNTKFKKRQKNKGLKDQRPIFSISLPAGYACPYAKECLSKAVPTGDGKRTIQDGPDTVFRCFSASQEAQYTQTFEARNRNFDLIKSTYRETRSIPKVADLIESSLLNKASKADAIAGLLVRIHVSGDFFAMYYLRAWMLVAKRNPTWTLYFYTKSTPLLKRLKEPLPANFIPTLSAGGTHDNLIPLLGLRSAQVVHSEAEAANRGLSIDNDDSLASAPTGGSFALLIHGTQPKKVA